MRNGFRSFREALGWGGPSARRRLGPAVVLESCEPRLMLSSDVIAAAIYKTLSYNQTSSAAPAILATGGYTDGAIVWGNPLAQGAIQSAIVGATVNPSNAGVLNSDPLDNEFKSNNHFDSKAALDNDAPPGVGLFVAMTTQLDGIHRFNFTVPAVDNYPNAPQVTNLSDLSNVNATLPLTINWSPQSNGTAGDFQQLSISDQSNNRVFTTPNVAETGALNGLATSFTVPPNILSANSSYAVNLTFIKVSEADTTTYPGATGFFAQGADTTVALTTNAIAPGPTATITTLSVPTGPAAVGTTVNITATVTDANGFPISSGDVILTDGVSMVGNQPLAVGSVTFTESSLVAGSHSFTAFYAGNENNETSHSDTQHFSVTAGAITFPVSGKIIATGPDAGSTPLVKVFDATSGALAYQFLAYDAAFPGAVRVATGDVNGDGFSDIITATGPGGQPLVNVFDGKTGAMVSNFYAYVPSYIGGVEITVADILGSGTPQIITATDAGGQPLVNVYNAGGTLLRNFFAYAPDYLGGVRIAATKATGSVPATILTATAGGGLPLINVFNSDTGSLVSNFYGAALSYSGGFYIATGDVNGDGVPDIVIANNAGSTPAVRIYDGATRQLLNTFDAYDAGFVGGVRVAAVATTSSGRADIITAPGAGGTPQINVFNALSGSLLDTFTAYDSSVRAGLFVSAAVNGD